MSAVISESFPRAPKICKTQADLFFNCFTANSVKRESDDKEAGVRGVQACLKEKILYEKCKQKFEQSNPPKRYRVY